MALTHGEYLIQVESERAAEAERAALRAQMLSRTSARPQPARAQGDQFSWMKEAACAGDLTFSPADTDTETLKEKADRIKRTAPICGGCAVRAQCDTFAETQQHDERSIWAGRTNEARRIARGLSRSVGLKPAKK